MKSNRKEIKAVRLTEISPAPRLGVLNLAWTCGKPREDAFFAVGLCWSAFVSVARPLARAGQSICPRHAASCPTELSLFVSKLMWVFQNLCVMNEFTITGEPTANGHQAARNLCRRLCLSPYRGCASNKSLRRERTVIRRKQDGIARTTEDLRGMRLSLVPPRNPGERLLPPM